MLTATSCFAQIMQNVDLHGSKWLKTVYRSASSSIDCIVFCLCSMLSSCIMLYRFAYLKNKKKTLNHRSSFTHLQQTPFGATVHSDKLSSGLSGSFCCLAGVHRLENLSAIHLKRKTISKFSGSVNQLLMPARLFTEN